MRSTKRISKKRVFFNPCDSIRTLYMVESLNARKKGNYTPKSSFLKPERYVKDNSGTACPAKVEINRMLSRYITKRGSKCLVLDGKKALTSRVLLKNPNVHVIDVPNYSSAYESLKLVKGINPYPVSLYDFVTFTKIKYNAMYLDTCGWFSTKNDDRDLKASIRVILRRRLLKIDGVIGLTVSKRSDSTQWSQAHDFMISNDFQMMYKTEYGQMCTMFFKRNPSCLDGHILSSTIVGDRCITCDVCHKTQQAYAITKSCEECDHDMCSVCYNIKRYI